MKTTNTLCRWSHAGMLAPEGFITDEHVHITLEFDLTPEDWRLAEESHEFTDEHTGVESDIGDHLLALLTYGIHRAYEERTGKPFVLRMDRPKN